MSESFVTRDALRLQLLERFPVENEKYEWKGWRSLKHHATGRSGDDVVSYVSAIANMEGAALVLGVKDGTPAVTGLARLSARIERLASRVFRHRPVCANENAKSLIYKACIGNRQKAFRQS